MSRRGSQRTPRRYPNRRHVDVSTTVERRRRRGLNRLSLVLTGLLILVFGGIAIMQRLDAGSGIDSTAEIPLPIPDAVPVEVVRVIDGDTFEARAADGSTITVRLFGVDTPERGEACYEEAAERLEALAGTHVQLIPDARLTDEFGRELRYAYTRDGIQIDRTLVVEGYGHAWTEDGAFRDNIVAAEAEARAAGRGCLWD